MLELLGILFTLTGATMWFVVVLLVLIVIVETFIEGVKARRDKAYGRKCVVDRE